MSGMGAIILAGGESRRMGFDKALLPYAGKTLLEEIVQRGRPFFEEIYVVVDQAKKTKRLDLSGAKVFEDVVPKAGPLAGLYTGLCHSAYPLNMVFTVDMPFVDGACILELKHAATENQSDVFCFETSDGNVQPFPGIYAKECLRWMQLLMDQNTRSMKRLFQIVDWRAIPAASEKERVFKNLNQCEDYWNTLDLQGKAP